MHDIKIPDSGSASSGKKPDFGITHISSSDRPSRSSAEQLMRPEGATTARSHEPGEKVKVKFDKFVQLVATHDFEEVMKRHADQDIILSTNLLTDLANAHEEEPRDAKKLPIFFIIGIIIGVVLTYLVIRF